MQILNKATTGTAPCVRIKLYYLISIKVYWLILKREKFEVTKMMKQTRKYTKKRRRLARKLTYNKKRRTPMISTKNTK
jgi:hypothetical protein